MYIHFLSEGIWWHFNKLSPPTLKQLEILMRHRFADMHPGTVLYVRQSLRIARVHPAAFLLLLVP